MRLPFSGSVRVSYAQMYVTSPSGNSAFDPLASMRGQSNGLCGAGVAGNLYLVTGLHTGHVDVTVELCDVAPPNNPQWEDVVEVSFQPNGVPVTLIALDADATTQLDLVPIDYRVRYSVSGMDQAHAQGTRPGVAPVSDRYLLQFWPMSPGPDQVLRQTGVNAAYRHDHARAIPPVPPRPVPTTDSTGRGWEERRRYEQLLWGGRVPSQRTRDAPNVEVLARTERALAHDLSGLDDEALRTIARWAAHRAYAAASLTTVTWASDVLARLDHGDHLPKITEVWLTLARDEEVPTTVVTPYNHAYPTVPQQHMALPAAWSAALADPLHAAIAAVADAIATVGTNHPDMLADLRAAFPILSHAGS